MYNEKLAYAENANTISAEQRPDFGRIVETLQKEAANGFELVDRLSHLSNAIKRIENVPEVCNDVKEKSPDCLVDFLWAEIWKIQRTNRQLEKCVVHLQRTIGS